MVISKPFGSKKQEEEEIGMKRIINSIWKHHNAWQCNYLLTIHTAYISSYEIAEKQIPQTKFAEKKHDKRYFEGKEHCEVCSDLNTFAFLLRLLSSRLENLSITMCHSLSLEYYEIGNSSRSIAIQLSADFMKSLQHEEAHRVLDIVSA